jgi:uncharacterized membrane-anchored protein
MLPGEAQPSATAPSRVLDKRQPLAAKVPEIALIFWAIKLITTGVGEAASDFMGQNSVPIAAIVGLGGFILTLRWQLRAREYRAPVYWSAVLMVAVFGTMVADGLKDGLGLKYTMTTPLFGVIVALIFWLWYRSEGTLSIHSITTRKREIFYWCAVLATFALGTAAGDLVAIQFNLGFFEAAALFAGLMAIPAIAWWQFGLSPIIAFWTCYVLTRPLGASFADGFSKPDTGGLGWGDGIVTLIGLVAFAVLVTYVAVTKHDIQNPSTGEAFEPSPVHAHHLGQHAADSAPLRQAVEPTDS